MNLLYLRKENKKNQQDIADMLNVARSTYNAYELGKNEPNIETLVKLADYYNVSLDFLIGRSFNNEVGYLSVDDKNFVKMYLSLDDYSKVKAIGYVAGLLASR